MSYKDPEFVKLMAARIVYQLCARGHCKMVGENVDEVQSHIKEARGLVASMIENKNPAERGKAGKERKETHEPSSQSS